MKNASSRTRGLDTSVMLGWLIEQGYEVICVYVDLGQPCEDREATLKKLVLWCESDSC